MIFTRNRDLLAAVFAVALCLTSVGAYAQKAPGFNTYIPRDILTPETVQTRIGTLNFV
jgi:hypothetical protein